MPVQFYTPRLVIRNISKKVVALFEDYRLQPGDTVDVFKVLEPSAIPADRVLKSLEKPTGDLYLEVVIKKTLEIIEFDLPEFHYNSISPSDLIANNTPSAGLVPSFLDDGTFEWVSASGGLIANYPLDITGNTISIPPVSNTQDGYLTKEDYALFKAGIKRQQKIWQYQDFSSPLGASLTLSAFQNGSGLSFNASYIVPDSAVAVLTSDNSKPPTTTLSIPGRWLPGNRVNVGSHTGTTVVLDQIPESSLDCRIWFLILLPAAEPIPSDYIEAPQFVAKGNLATLDDIYLNQEGNETIYGVKTFQNQAVFTDSLNIPVGATAGYVLTSDSVGNASWGPGGSTFSVTASRNHSKASNIYLRTSDGATTLSSPFLVPFNCNIIAISASSEDAATWDAEIHENMSLIAGAKVSVISSTSAYSNISVPVSAGARLQFFCRGSNVSHPRINIFLMRTT